MSPDRLSLVALSVCCCVAACASETRPDQVDTAVPDARDAGRSDAASLEVRDAGDGAMAFDGAAPDADLPPDARADAPLTLDASESLDTSFAFDVSFEFDASFAPDAPVEFDASFTPDTSVELDASSALDASSQLDSGEPATPDASPVDAPAAPDSSPACTGEEITTWSGAALDAVLAEREGIRFDARALTLETGIATSYPVVPVPGVLSARSMCAADFDADGWTDLAVATPITGRLVVLRNTTFDAPAPDWTDALAHREPLFTEARVLRLGAPTAGLSNVRVVCGDFNGRGGPDILFVAGTETVTTLAQHYILQRPGFLFFPPNDAFGPPLSLGDLPLSLYGGTDLAALDVDRDGRLELIAGLRQNVNYAVAVFSRTSADTRFTSRRPLLSGRDFGENGPDGFAFGDVTGDGLDDLVVAGTSQSAIRARRLQLFAGTSVGVFSQTGVPAGEFPGGGSVVVTTELTGDAWLDLVAITNNWNYNLGQGGRGFLYAGDGSASPFTAAPPEPLVSRNDPLTDVDYGVPLDYDHDPYGTTDLFIGDGAFVDQHFVVVQRRRIAPLASGMGKTLDVAPPLPLGATLEGASFTWTGTGSGSVQFQISVDGSAWIVCRDATCPTPAGTSLSWRVELVSNPLRTDAPRVESVTLRRRWRRC